MLARRIATSQTLQPRPHQLYPSLTFCPRRIPTLNRSLIAQYRNRRPVLDYLIQIYVSHIGYTFWASKLTGFMYLKLFFILEGKISTWNNPHCKRTPVWPRKMGSRKHSRKWLQSCLPASHLIHSICQDLKQHHGQELFKLCNSTEMFHAQSAQIFITLNTTSVPFWTALVHPMGGVLSGYASRFGTHTFSVISSGWHIVNYILLEGLTYVYALDDYETPSSTGCAYHNWRILREGYMYSWIIALWWLK